MKNNNYYIINTGRDLANILNIGDKFYVNNGSWYGIVKNKTDNSIIVDTYSHYSCTDRYLVKPNLTYEYDYNVDLEISVE